MNRQTVRDKMVKYLENSVNCKNIMEYIKKKDDRYPKSLEDSNQKSLELLYESVIIQNVSELNKLYETFDFMTESNFTGYECFPYIYGVINCEDSKYNTDTIYIFYENYNENIEKLIDEIQHVSEWYDIIFQFAVIHYYITIINHYEYNGNVVYHYYKKYPKPIYQEYELSGFKFNINHRSNIVYWNTEPMYKSQNIDIKKSNLFHLLTYIQNNKSNISIPPSERVMNILTDIIDNMNNIVEILNQYYNQK